MFLYVIRHRRTGKEYVGITTTAPAVRWRLHQSASRCGSSMLIHAAIRREGVEAFEMLLIGQADSLEALWRLEETVVRERNTVHPNGYNRAGGKPHFPSQKWTPEQREKLKPIRRAQVTDEVRERLRASHRGKTQPAEQRAKKSASLKRYYQQHTARRWTPEERARNSAGRREWWASRTPEQREALHRGLNANLRKARGLLAQRGHKDEAVSLS